MTQALVDRDDAAALRSEGLERLVGSGVVLLDGGLGSLLIAAGLEQGRAPEWWNLEHPERVEAAHRAYADAGSQILHANTFGASPPRLEAVGLAGRCREICRLGIALARHASEGRAFVAGDLGPTGLRLPPQGQASEAQIEDAFAQQAEALAEAGADLLSIETQYDLREALLATRACARTGLLVLSSMTFVPTGRGPFTLGGDPLADSLAALAAAGADGVGMNCSVTSTAMLAMARSLPEIPAPLVLQPNAGQPRASPSGWVYDADPQSFAEDMVRMAGLGGRFLGGCCGTAPGFVRALREALAEVRCSPIS